MKRIESEEEDELRPEYGFSQMKGGVRGKYLERYRAGTNLALLAPDVRLAFPTDDEVNQALRSIMQSRSSPARMDEGLCHWLYGRSSKFTSTR